MRAATATWLRSWWAGLPDQDQVILLGAAVLFPVVALVFAGITINSIW